ncbi:GerMN domain-containing protein [Desulforamulus aquiferis]|uniref:GerMN domain-containing protein n=1 Tax=Desulforamulus aquiferis TaxID=1397668 RepID=A0AAW7ZBA4_9FIRM|nr:GerMN domain-containing protein [Desulforamulus aquiferis]MDO7786366.1 GerMN domain-containing protein [Desulforamulus aquiferis]
MKKYTILVVMMILSLIVVGCGNSKTDQEAAPVLVEQEPSPERVKVVLYFANEQADALVPVEREIDKPNDMVVALVNELAKPDKLNPVIPEGTELIYYQKDGDTITLNFNQALANMQGSTGEFIAVNAIVNTITQLPEFNKVQLLVERSPLTTGHAVYDKPLVRDESTINK